MRPPGTEEWDGPRTLAEMYGEVDESLRPFLPDYGANLLLPGEIKDFEKFTTGNRQMFEVQSSSGRTSDDEIVDLMGLENTIITRIINYGYILNAYIIGDIGK